jgi:hypothetical protein
MTAAPPPASSSQTIPTIQRLADARNGSVSRPCGPRGVRVADATIRSRRRGACGGSFLLNIRSGA